MSVHPNMMAAWSEIACQRSDHRVRGGVHESRFVDVDLDGEHGYHDYTAIPARFARRFQIAIWPPELYPVDGGPYCPAHDAVSETIVSHRIWEPRETTLALTVCESAEPGQIMVDMGAQLGWFSLLACSADVGVIAYEADAENLRLLRSSIDANGWQSIFMAYHERVGPETAPLLRKSDGQPARIRFAKLDLEGAEDDAIRVLWPSISAGLVDHMMIEVSPVFADYYPALVAKIMDAGYRAYGLPPKARPPIQLDDPAILAEYELPRATVEATVASWHQEDVWFVRDGASW